MSQILDAPGALIIPERTELIRIISGFIVQTGIELIEKFLPDDTFLPGLSLGPGCMYVDFDKLRYPGDLLHEAGHLAVTTPEQRRAIGTDELEQPWPTDGEEIAAVLWSYAALRYLQLPPEVVFHPDGYKNQSSWLIDNFESGNYIGLPFLEWAGMALGPERARERNEQPFPHLLNWLRS